MKQYLIKAITIFAMSLPLASFAGGPGDYKVEGKNKDGDTYSGVASISKTGDGTYRIRWDLDGDKYEGFAVGDDKFLAISFSQGRDVGAAFLVEDDKGGYISVWAFKGDKKTGVELFTPKK
jgi:hypothetical protein